MPSSMGSSRPRVQPASLMSPEWQAGSLPLVPPESKTESQSATSNPLQPLGLYLACQAPPSMEFSRQESWSGQQFPPPGIFPAQGMNPVLPHCRQILYHLSHHGWEVLN